LSEPADKIGILFNPSAGKGKALKKRARLEHFLNKWEVPFDLTVTDSEQNLRELSRKFARRYRCLAGAGGDSTFQIIIDEIVRSGVEVDFGLIGLGSSNDVTREFELDSLEKACRALKRRRTRSIDLGVVESDGEILRYFIGQANIGLGAQVNGYVEEMARKRPRLAAFQIVAGTMGIRHSFRRKEVPLPLAVRADGQKKEGRYVVANFSNIRFWASGRILNPSARPDDGRLDGCLIGECSFLRLAHLALLARKGRHADAPEIEFLRAQEYDVSSERAFKVQVDGEIIGGSRTPRLFRSIRIRAVPESLRLIC
jgi:diacylglycerol kinase family enzyme